MLKEAEHGDHTCLGILLSGCSGIRIGELCALQWKDIQFARGTLCNPKTMQRIRTFETVWAEGKPVTVNWTKVQTAGPKPEFQQGTFAGAALLKPRRVCGMKDMLCREKRRNIRNREPFSTGFRGY